MSLRYPNILTDSNHYIIQGESNMPWDYFLYKVGFLIRTEGYLSPKNTNRSFKEATGQKAFQLRSWQPLQSDITLAAKVSEYIDALDLAMTYARCLKGLKRRGYVDLTSANIVASSVNSYLKGSLEPAGICR